MCDLQLPYSTVHRYVYYHLKAKLKVPRPVSNKQNTTQALKIMGECGVTMNALPFPRWLKSLFKLKR
ncbi:hypothetical protein [Okeania sp. SIO1I7]|uniref:hypothetical protein n=1 Tax=Okeania sp. SIO1I7 TaxID=2607772 RepID=UPI0013F9FD30|nr:hypothetical protein [Okeania sp. SIO1I7]NET24656.1 hypothetical protein [Okeania sp. SIO1I7]